ncbi:hypothetical protein [Dubosiella muris]|uniref:Uncharacterized protein n=1 Tax=Dubosiella muris TaxID=3038133 RepID=A0AC61RAB2_9FIRM|nr:hypothetical protein [Dubosiella muris]TGY67054.1 hypothetical protein E5336_01170 [Dubosiella muris]
MNKKFVLGALSLFLLAGCGTSTDTTKEETNEEATTTVDEAGGAQSSAEVTDADGAVTKAELEEENGKITSVSIDVIDKDGKSKKELGDEYNMKQASAIGKEWYEQVKYLEQFIIDNGIDAVKLNADGYAENEDLKSGCTINLTDIMEAVNEANNNNAQK